MGRIKLHRIILVAFFISCFNNIKAQQLSDISPLKSVIPEEYLNLNTTSNILLSGETLYYKVICLTKDGISDISKIVYTELVGENKSVVFKHKLQVSNGSANSDFILPTSLKTGHYKLIAYTQWSLNNQKEMFSEVDLYVINPFYNASENDLNTNLNKEDSYISIIKSTSYNNNINSSKDGNSLELNELNYSHREKVMFSINNHNIKSVSIAVNKIDALEVKFINTTLKEAHKNPNKNYLPELRGELISGRLINKESLEPVSNELVSLVLPKADILYYSTLTNLNGEFYFNINKDFDISKAIIQTSPNKKELLKIELSNTIFPYYNELIFYPLQLNTGIKDWIVSKSIQTQIENAYYSLKQDSIITNRDNLSFYTSPDRVYVLDDYKRFPTVRETFIEIIIGSGIRKNDSGQDKIMVFDEDDPYKTIFSNSHPIIFIDGYKINNHNTLIDFDPSNIESISLVEGLYVIGAETYYGIVDVKTKSKDFEINQNDYTKVLNRINTQPKKVYYQENYINSTNKRIPDFRTQLLWIPRSNLEYGNNNFAFYTSDNSGYYDIIVNGVTSTGKKISMNKRIQVK